MTGRYVPYAYIPEGNYKLISTVHVTGFWFESIKRGVLFVCTTSSQYRAQAPVFFGLSNIIPVCRYFLLMRVYLDVKWPHPAFIFVNWYRVVFLFSFWVFLGLFWVLFVQPNSFTFCYWCNFHIFHIHPRYTWWLHQIPGYLALNRTNSWRPSLALVF